MTTTFMHTRITKRDFDSILSRYASIVPNKLLHLDQLRYESIPAKVAQRTAAQRNDIQGVYLSKEEVEKLVEWKLSHGTFRPKLLQLVLSNDSGAIEKATRDAFQTTSQKETKSLAASIQQLTSLRGIGPATASLLLSVRCPDTIPFFSDELFRWVMWDDKEVGGGPGKWKRKIKYNAKEYEELAKRVGDMVERLGVRAVDCEKVAWVLGKERVDVGADVDAGDASGGSDAGTLGGEEQRGRGAPRVEKQVADGQVDKEITVSKERKRGVKRKDVDADRRPLEGTRKSARLRKDAP